MAATKQHGLSFIRGVDDGDLLSQWQLLSFD
jgi:hypothetical protein